MKIHKGDMVKIMSGSFDYRNKTGKVLKVFPDKDRIIVEGINIIKRHMRPSQKSPKGGILEKEAPIHVSKVMIICGKCNRTTRVGYKFLDDGSKVRICKHQDCGEILPVNV